MLISVRIVNDILIMKLGQIRVRPIMLGKNIKKEQRIRIKENTEEKKNKR